MHPPADVLAASYDATRSRVVALAFAPPDRLETWEWDGSGWARVVVAPVPLRTEAHLAFLPAAGTVLFGGSLASSSLYDDTWQWDGSSWQQLATPVAPAARQRAAVSRLEQPDRVVVFGGGTASGLVNDTWLLMDEADRAHFEVFGVGCSGSSGIPDLSTQPGRVPFLGTTFPIDVTNVPDSRVAVVWLLAGISRERSNGLQLPLDLEPFGMTGCELLVSTELDIELVNRSGAARADLVLPNDPALDGRSLFVQAFVLDLHANPLGATVSNGGVLVMGSL